MPYVTFNEDTVARFEKEGRGNGEGVDYKPWLRIGEVPPKKGRSHDPTGLKTNRAHQLLSDNELDFFLMLEWASDVVDIREQFPLSRTFTQEVAMQIGARHPFYPGTHCATVMTVDFLVTRVRNGQRTIHGYDVKETSEAENEESIAKLEISRETLQRMDISHDLVFSSQLPKTEVTRLSWIRGGQKRPEENEPYPNFFEEQMAAMAQDLRSTSFGGSLQDYCRKFDSKSGVARGTGLRVARMLMLARVVQGPLSSSKHIADLPLSEFFVTALPGQPHVVAGGDQ